jgi:Ni,Fe-hydrogenase III small subunit/NAD-dependent dihydropyrimidine dehydrogenase PreA subunit
MFKIILERMRQGYRTADWPRTAPTLPDRFRGLPRVDAARCDSGCRACMDACPYGAISRTDAGVAVDMGLCIFCGDCQQACATGALQFSTDHRLAATGRDRLVVPSSEQAMVTALQKKMRRMFGRSLKLRQVSAGGCNACEADVNVLGTLAFDMGRFGIQFVASPRHADGILVTGPVTENMRTALLDTYEAVPDPRIVIAQGACAIGGGPFRGSPAVHNGIGDLLPVDLYIPGCPAHPYTTLDGLLRLLGRIENGHR